ncbi:MAG: hypothetical protein J1E01_00235 [Acetatifactor sp.]|nr:hypothetical protein [Acetatifactor sp.]
MKKKLLSVLLAAAMVASLAACGGDDKTGDDAGNNVENDGGNAGGDGAEVTPDAIPDPFVHYTFDEGAGEAWKIVERAENAPGDNDGAIHGIVDSADTLGYADGPVGQALYLDGLHGLDLNFEPTNTDAYTVSFWMNADRLGQFGATLQMGYNVGKANDVAWMNITQTDWGDNSSNIFPVVWNRNARYNAQDGTACDAWMQAFDNEVHGKKEWAMITVVATGEKQEGLNAAGVEFTRAQLYINGAMVYDTKTVIDEQWGYDFCLAPGFMQPGDFKFEAWFGINYWDVIYKGFVDEFYVFDSALTAGQVLSLYQLGDPNVKSVAPEGTPVEEEPQNPVVTITGTAVGTDDFETGWWSVFSDGYAVPSGETVSKTFVNWHGAEAANWNNFIVVLQSEAVSPLEKSEACVEYAVLRADNWGWSIIDGEQINSDRLDVLGWTVENDWGDFSTLVADTQGATVTVSVTNNGDTADVECQIVSADGSTTHFQNYKNIPISGDLAFSLGVDHSLIDIQD